MATKRKRTYTYVISGGAGASEYNVRASDAKEARGKIQKRVKRSAGKHGSLPSGWKKIKRKEIKPLYRSK